MDSLKKCYLILKPNGILSIQLLNYEKILTENKRIINITEGSEKFYVRFYDFTGTEIIFNILTFSKLNLSDNSLISTLIYPHLQSDFITGLRKVGFSSFHFYSDFDLSSFEREQSGDLIIKAEKI